VTPSAEDARVRVARLTPKGFTERATLDERSDELAASIFEPLDDAQRAELVSAMRIAARLITASQVEFCQVTPTSSDAQRCLRAYTGELNRRSSQRGFDPGKGATADHMRCGHRGERSFSPTCAEKP
jgi:hypothetical protein